MLNQLIKFFKILNGDISPGQIAAGFAFGMMLAFTPFMSLHTIVVLLLVCVLRVNITATLIAMAVCALLAWPLDPYFIALGEYILTHPDLQSLWTQWYQSDLLRLAHFNNTMTMGSIVVSLALWLPVFVIGRLLVIHYRVRFMAYINRLRIVKWLKASRFTQMAFKAMEG